MTSKDTTVQLNNCVSISELFEATFKSKQNAEAIFDGERRLSYHDIEKEGIEVANGLHKLGIKRDDRVAVCLPTWYEFFVLTYAIAKIGAVLVPISTKYRHHELEYILQNAQPKAVFLTKEFDGVENFVQFQAIKKKLKIVELISVRFEYPGIISYKKLREMGKGVELQTLKVNVKGEVAAIIYSSGTTGKPKGVMLTHYNFFSRMMSNPRQLNNQEIFLHTATPYNHIMGLCELLIAIAYRGKVVLMDQYQVETALRLVEQEKVTIRFGVPTLFILEMNNPFFHLYDMSSLKSVTMAATTISPETIRKVKQKYGCHVQTAYGLTEICALGTFTSIEDDEFAQAETVGRPEEGVEVKVVDGQRKEVSIGQIGEIAFRSPGVMKGYYNLLERTQEVLDDEGWLYTGDLGQMDQRGYLKIVGRKKEMIIRGGFNIYPREIEDVFYTHPAVQSVAVVALPDTVLGEISCATIELKEGCKDTAEDLKRFIKERIADYKVPDHVLLIQNIPFTASGKMQKFKLKEKILRENLVSLR